MINAIGLGNLIHFIKTVENWFYHFVFVGTGSGSLSHSLIRTIRPHGRLYTYDFHQQRVDVAREEFQQHGLKEFVEVGHRDVCLEGFSDELDNKADAIFLDLPHPWLVVDHAVKALKNSGTFICIIQCWKREYLLDWKFSKNKFVTGGKLCSFSPCIEQVQQTCLRLEATAFVDIKTHECLQRELTVLFKPVPQLDLDCLKEKVRKNKINR